MTLYSDVTPAQKIAVLKAAIAGKRPPDIAHETGIPLPYVGQVLGRHGSPSEGKMRQAITMLTQQATEDGQDLKTAVTAKGIDHLVTVAMASTNARVRRAGERIDTLAAALKQLLAEDAADAKKRARIAELEAELARLKGKKVKPTSGPHACTHDGCDRMFMTTQARGMHEKQAHN